MPKFNPLRPPPSYLTADQFRMWINMAKRKAEEEYLDSLVIDSAREESLSGYIYALNTSYIQPLQQAQPASWWSSFPPMSVHDSSYHEEDLTDRASDESIPDSFVYLIAWRSWLYDRGQVRSLNVNRLWPIRETFHASCSSVPNSSIVPSTSCNCGIYGMKNIWSLHFQSVSVVGPVGLWGRVIEHQNGYRAQCAYPLHLYLPRIRVSYPKARLRALERYGCPVTVMPFGPRFLNDVEQHYREEKSHANRRV